MGLLTGAWAAFTRGLREGWRITPDHAKRLYEAGKITRPEYTAHLEAWWNDPEWEDDDEEPDD